MTHRSLARTLLVRPSPLVVLVLAALVAAPQRCASAENWPQWRGPAGDSVSRETSLPLSWSDRQNLAWKVPLPEWGTSTPAIWDDALFVTTQQDDRLLLLKLARSDGRVEWVRQVGTAETPRQAEKRSTQKFHRLHNNASPSPVTDGSVVVAHYGNGDLAAFDFDGRLLWRRNLQDDYGTYTIWWGHANSPLLLGDLVVSVCMQDSLADLADKLSPSYLVAHDKHTGQVRWKSPRMTGAEAEQCDSYTTPLLVSTARGPQLVVMGGNQVDAYDPADGRQMWHLGGIVGGRTITGPTSAHGMVYVTQGQRGDLLAVRLGALGKLSQSHIAWRHGDATPDSCCPVVWLDLLFIVADNGIAQCLDAHNGTVHWKQRLPGDYKASPLAADGRIYFLNTSGTATVVAADSRFQRLAENQIDDETIASPAVSQGRIYLRGRRHLWAIGPAAGSGR